MKKTFLFIIVFFLLTPSMPSAGENKSFKLATSIFPVPLLMVSETYAEYFVTPHLALGASYYGFDEGTFFNALFPPEKVNIYRTSGWGGHIKYYFSPGEDSFYVKAGYFDWMIDLKKNYNGDKRLTLFPDTEKVMSGSARFLGPNAEIGYTWIWERLTVDIGIMNGPSVNIDTVEDCDNALVDCDEDDPLDKETVRLRPVALLFQVRIGFIF